MVCPRHDVVLIRCSLGMMSHSSVVSWASRCTHFMFSYFVCHLFTCAVVFMWLCCNKMWFSCVFFYLSICQDCTNPNMSTIYLLSCVRQRGINAHLQGPTPASHIVSSATEIYRLSQSIDFRSSAQLVPIIFILFGEHGTHGRYSSLSGAICQKIGNLGNRTGDSSVYESSHLTIDPLTGHIIVRCWVHILLFPGRTSFRNNWLSGTFVSCASIVFAYTPVDELHKYDVTASNIDHALPLRVTVLQSRVGRHNRTTLFA